MGKNWGCLFNQILRVKKPGGGCLEKGANKRKKKRGRRSFKCARWQYNIQFVCLTFHVSDSSIWKGGITILSVRCGSAKRSLRLTSDQAWWERWFAMGGIGLKQENARGFTTTQQWGDKNEAQTHFCFPLLRSRVLGPHTSLFLSICTFLRPPPYQPPIGNRYFKQISWVCGRWENAPTAGSYRSKNLDNKFEHSEALVLSSWKPYQFFLWHGPKKKEAKIRLQYENPNLKANSKR